MKPRMVEIGKFIDIKREEDKHANDVCHRHFSGSLDLGRKKASQTASVLSRFRTMDSRGETENDTTLNTIHQNTIK